MKKIMNPWIGVDGYLCFACAPSNPSGLYMEFYEDGDDIVSFWKPTGYHQGWLDTLHGGIQSALVDELAAWVVVRKLQTTGVLEDGNQICQKHLDRRRGAYHSRTHQRTEAERRFRRNGNL